jgi:hypothetical protein
MIFTVKIYLQGLVMVAIFKEAFMLLFFFLMCKEATREGEDILE